MCINLLFLFSLALYLELFYFNRTSFFLVSCSEVSLTSKRIRGTLQASDPAPPNKTFSIVSLVEKQANHYKVAYHSQQVKQIWGRTKTHSGHMPHGPVPCDAPAPVQVISIAYSGPPAPIYNELWHRRRIFGQSCLHYTNTRWWTTSRILSCDYRLNFAMHV